MRFVVPMALLFACFTTASYADQVVRATWYGNEHRGHRTASGEVFNPGGMTAAHKSLAFGTCLLVGNPSTGKKVTVRVNDRGPFTPGVTLDLSSGAARAIGMNKASDGRDRMLTVVAEDRSGQSPLPLFALALPR
jgi:rare lipoprotein A